MKVRNKALGTVVNGWQVSGTAFWHSGVPLSVLSTPYSVNGNGIVQGSGRNLRALLKVPIVLVGNTISWLAI
jgi:hypothetical protein